MSKYNIFIQLLFFLMAIFIFDSCNQKDIKSDREGKDSSIINSKIEKTTTQELILCPVCKGTKKCVDCGGTGVAIYYDGSTQQCVSCGGTGVCENCNTPEKQLKIKMKYQSISDTSKAGISGQHSRTIEQIQIDLDKTNKLLMILKENLEKFKEKKESLDLQSQYRTIIIETEDKIQKLQQELSMAQ